MINRMLTAYRETVEPRMRGLPMYNPVLEVEAIDFERRDGRLSGVLITPWSMNLVVFPAAEDAWQNEDSAKTIEMRFPAGRHSCMLSALDGASPHLSLPLFTTVQHFADQDTARRVAREILRRLYLPASGERSAGLDDALRPAGGTRRTMTRRELLRGLGVRP